jgi:hypothetical protein
LGFPDRYGCPQASSTIAEGEAEELKMLACHLDQNAMARSGHRVKHIGRAGSLAAIAGKATDESRFSESRP